jgi:hypothetical protein
VIAANQQEAVNVKRKTLRVLPDDVDAYVQNMRTPIREKLRMFPAANMGIVNAFLEHVDGKKFRLSVVSTDQGK